MSTTTNRKVTRLGAGLDQPEFDVNGAFDNFDQRESKAAISVTTTNVTMTKDQQLCGVWEVSGLTAARQLIIDATLGSTHTPVVYNNSSYDLTVKTNASGSNRSVVIKPGKVRLLRHDNTHVDDAITETGAVIPRARVNHGSNQSIASTTDTALAFNQERYDTDAIHDNATNNTRLTCKTAGIYIISGHVAFAANATGQRAISIRLGGVDYIATQNNHGPNGADTLTMSVTTQYELAVGDYVELMVYQTSGGALNVLAGAKYSPEFSMMRVG
jgi:hypothetical protein